jgi:uncharacterized cupredoxin-like copper-binding protein
MDGTGLERVTPSLSSQSASGRRSGTYEYLCTIPGHAAGGMRGLLTVT